MVLRIARHSEPSLSDSVAGVGNGISDNDSKYYSLDAAREVLGYEPQDNAGAFTE